jgi:hypothetical protein
VAFSLSHKRDNRFRGPCSLSTAWRRWLASVTRENFLSTLRGNTQTRRHELEPTGTFICRCWSLYDTYNKIYIEVEGNVRLQIIANDKKGYF